MVEYFFEINDIDETQAWGETLASVLVAGDLIMLNGGLGAGKTTLTQGIGHGLGVEGRVSSPTFIVARVHPAGKRNLPLIHADAYRITDLKDLETLDLESSLNQSVTVIEWGAGKTEYLSANRLEISVIRPTGGQVTASAGVVDLSQLDDGKRQIRLKSFGDRWENVDWKGLFSAFPVLNSESTV